MTDTLTVTENFYENRYFQLYRLQRKLNHGDITKREYTRESKAIRHELTVASFILSSVIGMTAEGEIDAKCRNIARQREQANYSQSVRSSLYVNA